MVFAGRERVVRRKLVGWRIPACIFQSDDYVLVNFGEPLMFVNDRKVDSGPARNKINRGDARWHTFRKVTLPVCEDLLHISSVTTKLAHLFTLCYLPFHKHTKGK